MRINGTEQRNNIDTWDFLEKYAEEHHCRKSGVLNKSARQLDSHIKIKQNRKDHSKAAQSICLNLQEVNKKSASGGRHQGLGYHLG